MVINIAKRNQLIISAVVALVLSIVTIVQPIPEGFEAFYKFAIKSPKVGGIYGALILSSTIMWVVYIGIAVDLCHQYFQYCRGVRNKYYFRYDDDLVFRGFHFICVGFGLSLGLLSIALIYGLLF